MKTEKFKVTPLERAWILYDVGNSAFVLMIATLVPIFFNALAEAGGVSKVDYLPTGATQAPSSRWSPPFWAPFWARWRTPRALKSPSSCFAFSWASSAAVPWVWRHMAGLSGHFYHCQDRLLRQSGVLRLHAGRCDHPGADGHGVLPRVRVGLYRQLRAFVVCLALVLGSSAVGLSQMTALSIALVITAVWWLAVTLPLLKKYRQINYVEVEQHAIRQSFVRIGQTLKHLPQDKQVFWFLLAFFCYIDGVYTIIDMATAYGTALGLDTTGLLLALLVTQIVAFPSALIFGRLSQKYESKTLIPVCIAAYTGIAVFAFFLKSQWQFWVLAVVVGMFQGGVQALSRSHFARSSRRKIWRILWPVRHLRQGASFLGTMIVSVGSQLTGSATWVWAPLPSCLSSALYCSAFPPGRNRQSRPDHFMRKRSPERPQTFRASFLFRGVAVQNAVGRWQYGQNYHAKNTSLKKVELTY